MKKRFLAFVLSGAMLLSTVPSAFAAEVITVDDSQAAVTVQANVTTPGENLTWDYDKGTLTISGTGDMYNLKDAKVPWTVYMDRIKNITISDGVTGIGHSAFRYCDKVENVTIANSVTSIAEDAFRDCTSLKSIEIPDSVTSIGEQAFRNCTSLKSVKLPNKLTSIGENTFSSCTSLMSINIPDSVTSIGQSAFMRCEALTSVSMSNVTNIGGRAFRECTNLASIALPNTVTNIGKEAFSGCTSLTSIDIPLSVTEIGEQSFKNCEKLTSVTIQNGLTKIGKKAFNYCTSLKSIELPDTVTSMGTYVFQGCTGLENVKLSNGMTEVVEGTFENCSSLKSITIPDSVTGININAFQGCSGLESVALPSNLKSIDRQAFLGCTALQSIEIPSSVTSIGNEAFSGCTAMTSIDIPKNVTTIGTQVFSGCSTLKTITFRGDKPTIGENAFLGVSAVVRYPENNTTWDTALSGLNVKTETWNPENGTVNHVWQNGFCENCNEPCTHSGGTPEWATTATTHEKKYTCCGAFVVQTEEHEWDNDTCTECGYNCNHTGGTATCTEQATCEICGELYGEVDATNHTGTPKWTTTATTHEQKYTCCDAVVVQSQNHKWKDGVCTECGYECTHSGGKATCTEQAKCEICGLPYGDVNADNHTGNKVWTTTETEHTQTWDCCNATVVATEKHEWKDGVCTECGYKCKHAGGMSTCTSRAKCKYCGQRYGTVDSDYHTGWRVWETTATTHQQKYTCCGEVVVKSENHKWKDKVCEVCGYGCTHNEEIINAVPATCTKDGLTAGKKCTVCGVTFEGQEVVKTLGHTAVTDPLVKATRTKDGKTEGSHCSTCGEVLTEQQTIYKVSKIKLKKKYHTYYGKKHKPGVIVEDSQGNTIDKSNYKVKYYGNRKKVGKYKVTVKFKGTQYKGKKTLYFKIKK